MNNFDMTVSYAVPSCKIEEPNALVAYLMYIIRSYNPEALPLPEPGLHGDVNINMHRDTDDWKTVFNRFYRWKDILLSGRLRGTIEIGVVVNDGYAYITFINRS